MDVDYSTAHCGLSMKKLRQQVQRAFERIIDQHHTDFTHTDTPSKRPRNHSKQRKWRAIKRFRTLLDIKTEKGKWVQLAGHKDNFAIGEEGTILKKMTPVEKQMLELLMNDNLRPFVPEYRGVVSLDSTQYIDMEDLLQGFTDPCVMDCKMGVRTYLEEELNKLESNQEPRPDMYDKMVQVDANEPTAEEHAAKAVTKPRYMQFRERSSSTATLGFRIEGLKSPESSCCLLDFKTCKEYAAVEQAFQQFTQLQVSTIVQYLQRLRDLRDALTASPFFKTHEIIGSSLLFVHDKTKASVWMIDFGKTRRLEVGHVISHDSKWEKGNHEDGYLIGLSNIITTFESLLRSTSEN